MACLLVLPNQLFKSIDDEVLEDKPDIIIYEHPLFFTKYRYHKTKLAYHRATMKRYQDIMKKRHKVKYVEYDGNIKTELNRYKKIYIYDPTDFSIVSDLNRKISKSRDVVILETKLFIFDREEIREYVRSTKSKKKYINQNFYRWARQQTGVLMKNDKPIGGKYSYDSQNRSPFKKGQKKVQSFKNINNKYTKEARTYVEDNFDDNPGEITFYLPIDHNGARSRLRLFLTKLLKNFGKYQDAISSEVDFGYHSILSPMINIGLLDPFDVVESAEAHYQKSRSIDISSVEGFIRQILSWREYVRMMYVHEHRALVKGNYFKHNRKIKRSWYEGTTGIKPIDDCIKKVLKYSYAHHIERLMLLGGFMLIAKFSPKEVYKWFISLVSIDAYPWVMEPNVYGMSQFSCKDLMMGRPYFSSSNYIIKMSNYTKRSGEEIDLGDDSYSWADIWTALYYNFINSNKTYFKSNYSLASSVSNWNKKSAKDKAHLLKIARLYLKKY